MTVQRRLIVALLILVPLVWMLATAVSYVKTRHEVDELFDTQQVRLARQVLTSLGDSASDRRTDHPTSPPETTKPLDAKQAPTVSSASRIGEADLEDMAIVVWDKSGRLITRANAVFDIPFPVGSNGFHTLESAGLRWSVYYLIPEAGNRVVAIGSRQDERHEILNGFLLSNTVPWLFALPLLIFAVMFVVRQAFEPLRRLSTEIQNRSADSLEHVPLATVPADVQPLVASMNGLFDKMQVAIDNERRLTADASHELRTPIAALRAQFDALEMAGDKVGRSRALKQLGTAVDRLSRLVGQILNLSAIESGAIGQPNQRIDWTLVIEKSVSDVLGLMEQWGGDVVVDWPENPADAFPVRGDDALLTMMLRNLLDNSLRYAGRDGLVRISLRPDAIRIVDNGPGVVPEMLSQLGARFHRPSGQSQSGSGIGLSIVLRIARMHQMDIRFENLSEITSSVDAGDLASDVAGDVAVTRAARSTGLVVTITRQVDSTVAA
ncbi:MAG: ATP-binding protein [Burkholderiaceae bacterium]